MTAILAVPLEHNDVDAATIGEYLRMLLATLWREAEDFSSKRAFGNSDWQHVVYRALVKGQLVQGDFDKYGDLDHVDFTRANELIAQAIEALFTPPGTPTSAEEYDEYQNALVACGALLVTLMTGNTPATVEVVLDEQGMPTNMIDVRLGDFLLSKYRLTVTRVPDIEQDDPKEPSHAG
jgi:hypothetical protein